MRSACRPRQDRSAHSPRLSCETRMAERIVTRALAAAGERCLLRVALAHEQALAASGPIPHRRLH